MFPVNTAAIGVGKSLGSEVMCTSPACVLMTIPLCVCLSVHHSVDGSRSADQSVLFGKEILNKNHHSGIGLETLPRNFSLFDLGTLNVFLSLCNSVFLCRKRREV